MQAHLMSFLVAAVVLTATPALAQEQLTPEQPVCAHCGSDILSGGGAAQQAPQVGGDVQARPNSAGSDFLIRIPGVPGESSDPPPPPAAPAPSAPTSVTTPGQAVMPELPICAHCGADVQPQPSEEPRRRRAGFSLSIGGVTVGSGGVSVASGDVNGDNQDTGSQRAPVPSRSSDAPGRRSR